LETRSSDYQQCSAIYRQQVEYELASTPEFNNVSPDTLDGTLTTLTITGKGFGSVNDNIMVKIGGIECVVSNTDGDKSLIIGFSTKVLASCPVSLIKAVPRLPTPTPNVCRTPTIGELAASKEHLIC
jgi:hypothetical protein